MVIDSYTQHPNGVKQFWFATGSYQSYMTIDAEGKVLDCTFNYDSKQFAAMARAIARWCNRRA